MKLDEVAPTIARVKLPGESSVSFVPNAEGTAGTVWVSAFLGESTVPTFGAITFKASAPVNLDECDDVGLLKWISRLWIEIWVHEARERFEVDDDKVLNPHSADGDERFDDITWLGERYLGHMWTHSMFPPPVRA